MSKKRNDYISWHQYFGDLCDLTAKRSKDNRTIVGSCIVNNDNIIVGLGYNGLVRGMSDDDINWSNEGELKDTKHPYIIHAEANAILNSNSSVKGCTIYTSRYPCYECAKLIVQSGIKKVIYKGDIPEKEKYTISKKIFETCNIEVEKY